MQTVKNRVETTTGGTIDIIDYAPPYKADFKRLNLEWIEHYFCVEPIDEVLLSNPESYFLQPGGYIFFATCCGQVVGTCALLKHPDRGFELSKMGVTKSYRGMGIGRKLAETAIEKVRSLDEPQIFLETHSKLIPAVNLYKHLGFRPKAFPGGCSERYQRANLYMVLVL
ncbi:GNAT family N-acetyltransferase [Candidatus Entotheonella palauensis]|nr:GNAT family N-acetyltransferase [Candidatus Entotheonella palauensis]